MSTRDLPTFTGPNRTGEQQLSFLPALVRRDLRVVRADWVTPRYRRVVLTGESLDQGFPLVRFACNDHVKVYFPDPGTGVIRAYDAVGPDEWVLEEGDGESIRRDYTPRAWDPEARELTLDFVVHEHGVAGVWARDAAPGDPLVLMGPRANWLLPEDYGRYLAVGDETALPAISRLIEEAPSGSRVCAVVEVADAGEEQALVPGPGVTLDLRWVHRDTAPVGAGHGSALETAVRAVDLDGHPDDLYVFAAGEAGLMGQVRRYLRRERGIDPRRLCVDGYWKRGRADHDHHTNDLDDEAD